MFEKVYLIPVKKMCNAACSFCISKENTSNKVKEKMDLNTIDKENLISSLKIIKAIGIKKIEITGGGEPFLNKDLQQIIDLIKKEIPNSFIKLYSNGFLLNPITKVDELNISRSHYISSINNKIYRSKFQNDLKEALTYFRPQVTKLRVCTIMLKDIMDSNEEYEKMINHVGNLVDEFVLRPLIPEKTSCLPMATSFEPTNSKVKKDVIDCHCTKNIVIAPDGLIYENFSFLKRYKLENLCG